MKYLKILVKILVALLIICAVAVGIIIKLDYNTTSYLKLKNQPTLQQNSYLIKNVNVIPMTSDTVFRNQMVLIENGIISKVAKHIKNKDIEIIDGQNQFLSPGLIDMHVHVWDKQELGLYLSNGVTAVRNLWGMPFHLRLKEQIENQVIIAPQFFTSSPKLTGKDDLGDDKVQVSSPEEARILVNSYHKRGYDFIKTYAGMTEAEYIAIVEEAEILNIDVVAHPSFNVAYTEQFHPQIATIEHTEDIVQQPLNYKLDTLKLQQIAREMAMRKQAFSPTLTGFYKIFEMLTDPNIENSTQTQYINPLLFEMDSKNQIARWQNEKTQNPSTTKRIKDQHNFHLYAINQLHKQGVTIVSSTDAGIALTAPGFAIHQELNFYKQADLSNFEVLKTSTINPSKVHSQFNNMGRIVEGNLANFNLTIENPLENLNTLSTPVWVMVQGRKIDKNILQEFESKAKNRSNKLISALRWVENLWVEK
ncbi:amidohydrolase family protein [Urechidicola vernalis]|uniref:Amidohydrolase family protein n=1 Tax=Urechidicola vernalis TaxID=3075600 RepID=A0ABU2Y3F8_9FLAO|nr:amidohydrolase family protein [Urechidicola sp. P050]MDT0552738.1 amidohydrolase family protein [Urechidicola sp. P050]